jgi:hypothetical protein
VRFVFTLSINRPTSYYVAEFPALACLRYAERGARVRVDGVAKEPLLTTRNVEGRRSCMCGEKPETGPSLKTSSVNMTGQGFALSIDVCHL